ncbi:MAG: beta-propeller domain-containing protein, partial [Erythrobacter sp.]|nr:beta-propeller domain-containing protein [Erythrobacter sp.]
MKRILVSVLMAGALPACATLPKSSDADGPVPMLEGEQQIGRYMARLQREWDRRQSDVPEGSNRIIVTGSRIDNSPTITNNQEAGVDEGGIVKVSGNYLVVLRRGRLFSLRVAGDRLEAVSSIDAFPPGDTNPDDTWYDELLVSGDTIVSIGYSYADFGEGGTEISRFRLREDGSFEYRDTHYRSSDDYYSSRNYASRMIGDTLLVYAPSSLSYDDWMSDWPSLTRRRADGSREPVVLDGGQYRLAVPQRHLNDIHPGMSELHSILRCDVQSEDFDCTQYGVLGGDSREFYITFDATYI